MARMASDAHTAATVGKAAAKNPLARAVGSAMFSAALAEANASATKGKKY